jgi:Spy/CpxP family protein refolding chaperone
MTDQNATPQTTTPHIIAPPPRRRGIRPAWVVVLVAAAGLTGAVATASSQGFGPGFGHHFGHWRGGMMGFDPAQAEERAERMMRHLAIELDATNEQADKLRVIVRSAVRDIVPMRDKALATRTQARVLLTEPAINRAEIERLRTEQVALVDTFSKRVAQALGDAGEVLNPEQRRKLASHLPPPGTMPPFGGPPRFWNR